MKYTHDEFRAKFSHGYTSICPICEKTLTRAYMSRHLSSHHNTTPQSLYDELVGKTNCVVCGGEVEFSGLFSGYYSICSPGCQKVLNSNKAKDQWATESFRSLMTDTSNRLWSDPSHIAYMREVFDSKEWSEVHSEAAKKMWSDPDTRLYLTSCIVESWRENYKERILSNYVSECTDPYVFYLIRLPDGMIKIGSGMENRPKIVSLKMGGEIIKVIHTSVKIAMGLEGKILDRFWNPEEMLRKYNTLEVVPPESLPFIEELINENCGD